MKRDGASKWTSGSDGRLAKAPGRRKRYDFISAMALDPIEKKPFARFMPGSSILSIGFFGCNMHCPFCQNHQISQRGAKGARSLRVSPEELAEEAKALQETDANIGMAYTYSEPLVHHPFVCDTAQLIHAAGLVNVLVTNGQCSGAVMDKVLPFMDAVNVDLKGFRPEIYEKLGGDLATAMRFITAAAKTCHVEVTSLIVPGLNDNPDEMREEAAWLASVNPEMPLHITRYFPMYKMTAPPTDAGLLRQFKTIAEEKLKYVYLGNV